MTTFSSTRNALDVCFRDSSEAPFVRNLTLLILRLLLPFLQTYSSRLVCPCSQVADKLTSWLSAGLQFAVCFRSVTWLSFYSFSQVIWIARSSRQFLVVGGQKSASLHSDRFSGGRITYMWVCSSPLRHNDIRTLREIVKQWTPTRGCRDCTVKGVKKVVAKQKHVLRAG